MELINAIQVSISQLIVFSLLPFVWWIVSGRKQKNFFSWIGLTRVSGSARLITLTVFSFFGLMVLSQLLLVPLLLDREVVAQSQWAGMGSVALAPAFFFAMVQTGLSEEILFRGFLGKRLSARFGFLTGNLLQASLFGLIHGMLFLLIGNVSWIAALLITLITGLGGWILGYLTEKAAGGSIIPAWLIHGSGNYLLAMLEAYELFAVGG